MRRPAFIVVIFLATVVLMGMAYGWHLQRLAVVTLQNDTRAAVHPLDLRVNYPTKSTTYQLNTILNVGARIGDTAIVCPSISIKMEPFDSVTLDFLDSDGQLRAVTFQSQGNFTLSSGLNMSLQSDGIKEPSLQIQARFR